MIKPGEALYSLPGAEAAGAFNPDNPYAYWSGDNPFLRAFNPDDLVKSKGILIYKHMTREPFIKAALMQKKTALLSVPWDVKPASQDPEHLKHARFIKYVLKNIAGGFQRDLFEMCDALDCGYAIMEKIPAIVASGEWAGKVVYSALKSKDPEYFAFNFDQYMNLRPDIGVVMLLAADGRVYVGLPPEKFFVFSYLKRYENWYGTSDLRATYRAFWIKDTAWKLRSVYMERFSGKNLKGKYPRNKEANQNKEALLAIFRAWQNETGIAIPNDLEVEAMEVAVSSESEYSRSISDCNKEISIGILGEALTVDEGKKTGSRNMGEIHKEVADLQVLFLDAVLTSDINEQLVRQIIDINFAAVDAYPEFFFFPREDYDPVAFGQFLTSMQEIGMPLSKNWIQLRTRMPEPAGPGDTLIPIAAASATAPKPANASSLENQTSFSEKKVAGGSPGPYYRPLDKHEQFAEVQNIDKQTMALVAGAKAQASPAYLKIKAAILDQVQKKQVLENKDFEAAAKISVNTKPLQEVFQQTLLTADLMGRASAVKNIKNQGFSIKGLVKKFAESDNWENIDAPVGPEEAVKYFSGKIPMTKEEYQALIDAKYQQAFYVAGLEKTQITKDVQNLLTQALKNGWDYKKFKFELDRTFDEYAKSNWEQQGTTSEKITDAHAETVFRTNIMDAYNQGRKEVLSDPDVMEDFPAWMLSCILDGRTRPWHADMDGATFLANDPIWDRITPPNGYNCREVIVPINKYDFTTDMLWDESDIPSDYPTRVLKERQDHGNHCK